MNVTVTNRLKIAVALAGSVLAPGVAAADGLGNGEREEVRGEALLPALAPVFSCPSPVTGNQGLAFDGQYLWIADFDTDRAYQVDPATCLAVRSIPLPGGYPTGLAWDGTYLWHADGTNQRIYQIDPADGTVVTSFPSSGNFPVGLAWDGLHLWNSDTDCNLFPCFPDEIHELTTSGSVVRTAPGLGDFPTGLAFDGRYLWHSDNSTDAIYKIDPVDLAVVDFFASPGDFPNDLAWDGRYLWVVDNGTDFLYQYDVGISVTDVPTLPGTGLAVLALLLAASGCAFVRRLGG